VGWGVKHLTLATVGFERYAKTTRRAAFLDEMDRVVPWSPSSVDFLLSGDDARYGRINA
jgi:hypothetical protein